MYFILILVINLEEAKIRLYKAPLFPRYKSPLSLKTLNIYDKKALEAIHFLRWALVNLTEKELKDNLRG